MAFDFGINSNPGDVIEHRGGDLPEGIPGGSPLKLDQNRDGGGVVITCEIEVSDPVRELEGDGIGPACRCDSIFLLLGDPGPRSPS